MAYTFDSTTDRISFTSSANFPQTGSLAMWFKPTWAQTDGVDHVFFEVFENASPVTFRMQKTTTNSLLLGWYWGGVGDFRVSVASGSYTITQNVWNHLALTWDDTANETRAYLNGSLIGTPTSTLQAFTSSKTRYIGNYDSSAGSANFAGDIAEVAIWESVLSAGDVAALNRGVAPALVASSGIVDYLPLLRDAVNVAGNAPTYTNVAVAPHCRIIYQRSERQFGHATATPPPPVNFAPTVVGASTVVLPLWQYLAPTVTSSSTVTCRVLSGPPVTLTIQPDATTGVDAVANHALPTTNNGTATGLALGGSTSTDPAYAHLKFPLTGTTINDGAYAGVMSVFTAATATADRDYEAWLLDASNQSWTELGLTWNTRDGSNAWTGGANGGGVAGVDTGPVAIGTGHYTANDPVDSEIAITLTPSSLASAMGGTFYVVLKRTGTTTATSPTLRSSDSSIVASRPKLVVSYVTTALFIGSPSSVGASSLDVVLSVPVVPTFAVDVDGSASLSVALTTPALLVATVASSTTVVASMSSRPLFSFASVSTSVVDASLGGVAQLVVTVAGSTTVSAGVMTTARLSVSVVGASSVTVDLTVPAGVALNVTVASATSVSAGLTTRPLLVVDVASVSTVVASLRSSLVVFLVVSIDASSVVAVRVATPVSFAPVVVAVSTLTASVAIGVPPLVVYQPLAGVLLDDGRRAGVLWSSGRQAGVVRASATGGALVRSRDLALVG